MSKDKPRKSPLKTTEIGRTAKYVRRNLMGQLVLDIERHQKKYLDTKNRLKKVGKVNSLRKFKSNLEYEH